jgi:hypothetical protein
MLGKVLLTLMLRKSFINPNAEIGFINTNVEKGFINPNVEKGLINPNIETQPPCVQQRAGSGERGDQCDPGL